MKKYNEFCFSPLLMMIFTFVFISVASIAYASFNTTLTMFEGQVAFRPVADIRIVDFKLLNVTNGGIEEYNSTYSKNNINVGLSLPNLDSSLTYEITVTNFVDLTMILSVINNINFSNDNMEYRLIDMQIDDLISGVTSKNFYIAFKYKDDILNLPSNTSLDVDLEFIFRTDDIEAPLIIDLNKSKEFFITQKDDIKLEALVSAYDNIDGDITEFIEISSNPVFNKNETGTYTITYNVKDASGNSAIPLSLDVIIWNFIKIVNGQYHGIALGSNGSVWTCGWNGYGQRGIGISTASAAEFRTPTQIPQSYFDDLPVIDIAAGYSNGFAINNAGQAYGWGQGTSYQLGNNSTSRQNSPVPLIQPDGIKFTQISSFYQTGAALGNDRNIYTWGYTLYGANGQADNNTVPSPITTSGDFVQVSQGFYGGSAVNDKGQVYVWGTNIEGQLGTGSTGGYNNPPTLVTKVLENVRIKQISYGIYHLLALAESGEVYSWGSGGSGRLCLNSLTAKSSPTLIPDINNASLVNAAYDFSQILVGNNIYSCGYANFGELFGGNLSSQRVPYLSTMTNVADNVSYLAGKYDNAYILSKNGATVYGIGFSDSPGQEFGNISVQTSSTSEAIPWSFTPPPIH